MKNFKGVFPALMTPYKTDGSLNGASVKKLIDMNLQKGVSGFYVGGSTGEGLLMTKEERAELFDVAAAANGGRGTMIAHVGTINTDHAVEMAKRAQNAGFDAVSAIAPYYYGFSKDAILNYYYDIAESTSLPVIIYNFPNANGFSLTKSIVEEIFRNPKFIGIKHTTPDFYALQQFKTVKEDILVYNGYDEMFLGGLAMGADGGIGSTYNFMAEKFVAIYNAFKAENIFEAQKIQNEVNEIISVLIKYGVFVSEKAILEEMGVEMGGCKKPFLPISEEGRDRMRIIAKKLLF